MYKRLIYFILFLLFVCHLEARNDKKSSVELLKSVISIIDSKYVDSIDDKAVTYAAIKGMVSQLDPHSQFLTPDEQLEFSNRIKSNIVGLGIYYRIVYDTLTVVRVQRDSPAYEVGLAPNDKLISIDGKSLLDTCLDYSQVHKLFLGKRGSIAHLVYWRPTKGKIADSTDFKNVEIVRDLIPQKSIHSAYMCDEHIGYIAISSFSENTANEFKEALRKLIQTGMTQLVLDLRNNPGGYLAKALNIIGQFLSDDEVMLLTRSSNEAPSIYEDNVEGLFESGDIVVLINEHSASASEVVAAALQDQERATIIGRRSFGKGLVQRRFPFSDGSELVLTVSRYYSPSGRCLQKPFSHDAQSNLRTYENEIQNRFNSGELFKKQVRDTLHAKVFYTLKKKHAKVYAHGGVSPDIFVPLDSMLVTNRLYKSEKKYGIIFERVTDYYLTHISSLKSDYKTWSIFEKEFKEENLLVDVLNQLEELGVDYNLIDVQVCRSSFKLDIKAVLASLLFEDVKYASKVRNVQDASMSKALTHLRNK